MILKQKYFQMDKSFEGFWNWFPTLLAFLENEFVLKETKCIYILVISYLNLHVFTITA